MVSNQKNANESETAAALPAIGILEPVQYKLIFQHNPDVLDLAVIFLSDLFEIGQTPEQQARANKAREMLAQMGILKYGEEAPFRGSPSLESVKELLRKILT